MASQRIGELDFSETGHSTHHVPYGIHHRINNNNPSSSLMNEESGFDFGELEEAIVLQGVKNGNDETKASFFTARPAATLEMFPSWPMRFHQTSTVGGGNKSGGESSDSALSSKNENPFEPESPLSSKKASSFSSDHNNNNMDQQNLQLQQQKMIISNDASAAIRTASSSQNQISAAAKEKKKGAGSTSDKPLDAKTLRRLAQNREAARKSRLRKKAYVQQLESSRLKLTQLEQDLQRARSQGMFMDWSGGVGGNISSGGAMFDMEYGRWLEEDNRLLTELRNGLQAALTDNEMRVMVDGYLFSSWLKNFGRHLQQKSLYALGLCSEFQLTPDDTLLFGLDSYDYTDKPRGKAVFHHKFPHHDLTVEAVYPGLFVDKIGNYWDVPLSMAIDLASLTTSDSLSGYHLSAHYNSGSPKQFESIQNQNDRVPQTLLPGLAFKSVFSYRKNLDIWRSETPKLKLIQPYDIFLSNPLVSASGMIGAAATAYFGENSTRAQIDDDGQQSSGLFLQAPGIKSSFLADIFGSVSFTAQHGNFQRLFLDLSRFQARLDFPSGSKFLLGATSLAQDLLNSQKPNMEAVQAICPNATLSLQQQIVGPISFRVDSGIAIDLKNHKWPIQAQDPIFAVEWALQVLGSAKAVAWCCPKRQEFMVELRFYET